MQFTKRLKCSEIYEDFFVCQLPDSNSKLIAFERIFLQNGNVIVADFVSRIAGFCAYSACMLPLKIYSKNKRAPARRHFRAPVCILSR
jgi:dihydrodipicolinate synthase/N-acetylneuraminate lyase